MKPMFWITLEIRTSNSSYLFINYINLNFIMIKNIFFCTILDSFFLFQIISLELLMHFKCSLYTYIYKKEERSLLLLTKISLISILYIFTLYIISCVKFYYTFIKLSLLIPHLVTGTCFSKHVRSNCVFQARTVPGRETSCTSCKTSGRHSF